MSSASIGIIASRPNIFPTPPGIPTNAVRIGLGLEYWHIASTSHCNPSYSQARYVDGQYYGGWEANPDFTSSSFYYFLNSSGTWATNLPAGTIWIYCKGTGPYFFNDGYLEMIPNKDGGGLNDQLTRFYVSEGLNQSKYLLAYGNFPLSAIGFELNLITDILSAASIIAIYIS